MAQLLVRNLPEELVTLLKRLAAENGVSAEEQHRRILKEMLASPKRVKAVNSKRVSTKSKKKGASSKKGAYPLMDHLMAMPNVGEDWMFDRNDPRNARPKRREQLDFGKGS